MRYLIEKIYQVGSLPPGLDRVEVVGARYEISDLIQIFDYDDNLVLSVEIDRNDDCFKFINMDNNEIIFQNQ